MKIYGGGIRGIKALRKHRKAPEGGAEDETKEEEEVIDVSGPNRFERFERRPSAKPKRKIY